MDCATLCAICLTALLPTKARASTYTATKVYPLAIAPFLTYISFYYM